MGHLGVPRKKLVKGNECFIFYFCVLSSPRLSQNLSLGDGAVFGGYMLSDNSFSCFRRKAFYKSDSVTRFTTSVALIQYIVCAF